MPHQHRRNATSVGGSDLPEVIPEICEPAWNKHEARSQLDLNSANQRGHYSVVKREGGTAGCGGNMSADARSIWRRLYGNSWHPQIRPARPLRSFTTGSSRQQAQPFPLCPDSEQIPQPSEMSRCARSGLQCAPIMLIATDYGLTLVRWQSRWQ